MSDRKTIKVNPIYFSLKGSKQKTNKNNKKQKRKAKLKSMSDFIKPNKAKKELLKKIKEYQQQKKREQEELEKQDIVEFTENMKDSMEYLQNVIKENRKKRELKKTQKNNNNLYKNNGSINNYISNSSDIIITDHNINDKTISKNTIENNLTETHKANHMNKENILEPSNLNTKEPEYGCLKGGKKPTYKQYMKTLKNRVKPIQIQSISSEIRNHNPHIERKEKLNKLIHSSATSNHKIDKRKSKFKRYKIRKLYKTYKVGKNKKTIGILLKNNSTRKKVINELNQLNKTPIAKVKMFLREKNLLKLGSNAPDHILRQTFINSILSGDIINKNYDVMIHNYFH